MKTQAVALMIRCDEDKVDPASWDWPELLDLPDKGDVQVIYIGEVKVDAPDAPADDAPDAPADEQLVEGGVEGGV